MNESPEPPPSPTQAPRQPGPGFQSYPPPLTPSNAPMGQSVDDKSLAVITWVISILFPLIGPGLIFVLSSTQPVAKRQAAHSIVSSLFMQLVGLALTPLMLLTVFAGRGAAPFIFAIVGVQLMNFLVHMVLCITGAVVCYRGENFSPPVISRITAALFKM